MLQQLVIQLLFEGQRSLINALKLNIKLLIKIVFACEFFFRLRPERLFADTIILPFLFFKFFYFLEQGGDRSNRCSLSEG